MLRERVGLTATDLARAMRQRGIKCHEKLISAIENGARPSPEMARAIVWVLAELGAEVEAEFSADLACMERLVAV